jgi:glycosyltransferase involved in cell wall biosynthesis
MPKEILMSARVLFVGLEKTWRGGENQIFLLCKGLKEKSAQAHVAYPKSSQGAERFSELGNFLALPSRSSADPRSLFALVRYCKKNSIQILDANSAGAHRLALWVNSFLPELKIVVHRRVDNPIRERSSTKRKYLSSKVDRFVAISDCIAGMLIDYGVKEDRVSVVKSAVDPHKYDAIDRNLARRKFCQEQGVSEKTTLIGNAAAFTDQKGHEVLIDALNLIKGEDFVCLLAGDGNLKPGIVEKVKAFGLQEKVRFLGFRSDVPELLKALDIMVLPSNNEGLGTIFLDAASAGCALIGTRIGGIPEIISDSDSGYLVDVGDSQTLAARIVDLLHDAEKRQSFSQKVREHVLSNFSLQTMVDGNFKVYQELLGL